MEIMTPRLDEPYLLIIPTHFDFAYAQLKRAGGSSTGLGSVKGCFELLLLDLCTGLRRGELLALQWDDLDFSTGMLTVEKQVCEVKGQPQLRVPKTKASIRKLVLSTGGWRCCGSIGGA